jgi:predicted nuclease with TOPRIM domain
MRRTILCLLVLSLSGTSALALQDAGNVEQLKKMYEDALQQLRVAQDRKNELAQENERLMARIGELEQKLSLMTAQAAEFHERTLFLRAHHVAWKRFLARDPELRARWQLFLERDGDAVPGERLELFDPAWPMTVDD